MPAVSEAQRRLLNARFGHAWVKRHHFDNKGKLPERVGSPVKKKAAKKKKRPKNKGQKIHRNKHGTTVTYGSY